MPDPIPHLSNLRPGQPVPLDHRERMAFYSGKRWRKLRGRFLARHPLCAHCLKKGNYTSATVVHHIIERLDDPKLAYDPDNLESVCASCHRKHHNEVSRAKKLSAPTSMKSSPSRGLISPRTNSNHDPDTS